MDLGPGLYVFSFGLMLGLRMQRQLAQRKALLQSIQKHPGAEHEGQVVKKCTHSRSNSPATLLLRAARSVGPLAALGAARLVLTKTVEYQVRTRRTACQMFTVIYHSYLNFGPMSVCSAVN